MTETYTPEPDLYPPSETIFVYSEDIENLLQRPESAQEILGRRANRARNLIATAMLPQPEGEPYEPRVQELEANDFDALFDPDLPTIAIDLCSSFRGAELTAFEAQRKRIEQGYSMNVLLFRGDTDCASLVTLEDGTEHKGALEIIQGILVGPEGDVYYGKLPIPIYTSLLETNNQLLLKQCLDIGIRTLNRPDDIAEFESKSSIEQIAARAKMSAPTRFTDDVIRSSWPKNGLVLKPSVGTGGGKGIVIARSKEREYELLSFYKVLEQKGFKPLIEEYIESYPLRDPVTGERLAWNARVVIAEGELIDILIRAHSRDIPGNTSLGATEFPFENLSEYLPTRKDADHLIAQLIDCGKQLAVAINTGAAGADVMIGPDLKRYLIEVNTGQFGALDEICDLTADYSRKRQPHQLLLDAWRAAYANSVSNARQGRVISRQQIQKDNISLFKGLYDLGRQDLFSYIPLSRLKERSSNLPFDSWLWICSRLARKNVDVTNPDEQDISKDLIEYTPAELISRASRIVPQLKNPYDLRETLEVLLDIRPGHPELVKARRLAVDSLYLRRQSNHSTS